ncbi:MAG: hypothetical protein M1820_008956 [Bogoriella megaspora]|nr:MAG: hypothetical protein M1820_008956 [Bogoriella megaspora]
MIRIPHPGFTIQELLLWIYGSLKVLKKFPNYKSQAGVRQLRRVLQLLHGTLTQFRRTDERRRHFPTGARFIRTLEEIRHFIDTHSRLKAGHVQTESEDPAWHHNWGKYKRDWTEASWPQAGELSSRLRSEFGFVFDFLLAVEWKYTDAFQVNQASRSWEGAAKSAEYQKLVPNSESPTSPIKLTWQKIEEIANKYKRTAGITGGQALTEASEVAQADIIKLREEFYDYLELPGSYRNSKSVRSLVLRPESALVETTNTLGSSPRRESNLPAINEESPLDNSPPINAADPDRSVLETSEKQPKVHHIDIPQQRWGSNSSVPSIPRTPATASDRTRSASFADSYSTGLTSDNDSTQEAPALSAKLNLRTSDSLIVEGPLWLRSLSTNPSWKILTWSSQNCEEYLQHFLPWHTHPYTRHINYFQRNTVEFKEEHKVVINKRLRKGRVEYIFESKDDTHPFQEFVRQLTLEHTFNVSSINDQHKFANHALADAEQVKIWKDDYYPTDWILSFYAGAGKGLSLIEGHVEFFRSWFKTPCDKDKRGRIVILRLLGESQSRNSSFGLFNKRRKSSINNGNNSLPATSIPVPGSDAASAAMVVPTDLPDFETFVEWFDKSESSELVRFAPSYSVQQNDPQQHFQPINSTGPSRHDGLSPRSQYINGFFNTDTQPYRPELPRVWTIESESSFEPVVSLRPGGQDPYGSSARTPSRPISGAGSSVGVPADSTSQNEHLSGPDSVSSDSDDEPMTRPSAPARSPSRGLSAVEASGTDPNVARLYSLCRAHFQRVADLAHKWVEYYLSQAKIPGKVSSRAKSESSYMPKFHRKLEELRTASGLNTSSDGTLSLATVSKIMGDIKDAAGVHIYVLGHDNVEAVKQLIITHFECVGEKDFAKNPVLSRGNRQRQDEYEPLCGEYNAHHFYIRLRPEHCLLEFEYTETIVEVQISWLFVGVLNDIEHDILYKPKNGPPKVGTRRILDGLRGIVQGMEVVLAGQMMQQQPSILPGG